MANDSEYGDDLPVSITLGEVRKLISAFRRLHAVCGAMANGADQQARGAQDFAKWCREMAR